MNRKSTHFTILLGTLAMMINHGHYAHGEGYQGSDRHFKEADNGDNSGSANYNFEYGVDDGGTGPQFGHQEERNGYETRGRYSVLLPDGRLQVVNYKADKNGYVADVTYENGPAQSNNEGYNSNMGNHGYENAATSYGPPPPAPTQHNDNNNNNNNKGGGYNDNQKGFRSGNANKGFGRRSSRSFVKLRRTVNGRQFNYMY